jgi:1-acyl-sn-glycerol-3-phosphate acyltransferase
MKPVVPELPPCAPRAGSAFSRWIGRTALRIFGWRVVGEFPDLPRMVLVIAPHSSFWDGILGIAGMLALGVRIEFMVKAELFRGPLGWFLRSVGGVPVNRSRAQGAVQQAAARLEREGSTWILIAPEGTRRRVEHWKTGFWHIARAANVPVFCTYFHYPERTMGLGELMEITDDVEADMAKLRKWYVPYVGKNRGTV